MSKRRPWISVHIRLGISWRFTLVEIIRDLLERLG